MANVSGRTACSCGKCAVCTPIILAALRREATPPKQRGTNVGALVELPRQR